MKSLKPATPGPVSSGTLRVEDLLTRFLHEMERFQSINGEFLAQPENLGLRNEIADAWPRPPGHWPGINPEPQRH